MDYSKWVVLGKSFGLTVKDLLDFVDQKEREYYVEFDEQRKKEEHDA
jgi:colicin import membrane protein